MCVGGVLWVLSLHCSVTRLRVRKHGKDNTKPHNFLVAATHLKALPSESGCRGWLTERMWGRECGVGEEVSAAVDFFPSLSLQRHRFCSEPWPIPVPCTRSPTRGT